MQSENPRFPLQTGQRCERHSAIRKSGRPGLNPEFNAGTEGCGEDLVQSSDGFFRGGAGTEVCKDDEFVLESLFAVEEIVEVHVAEFVDFFTAMGGSEERHFRDQDVAGVDIGMGIESVGGGIAGEADERCEEFGGDFDSLHADVADLVTGESGEFGSEFFADIVDDVAD